MSWRIHLNAWLRRYYDMFKAELAYIDIDFSTKRLGFQQKPWDRVINFVNTQGAVI